MRAVAFLSLLAGVGVLVRADTCGVAPANETVGYIGPNGVEDPSGSKSPDKIHRDQPANSIVRWCKSQQSVCGLSCHSSVLVNDCTRNVDVTTQAGTYCWACTCADGSVPPMVGYMGTISTLVCSRLYSNCLHEAAQSSAPYPFTIGIANCDRLYPCGRNDAGNLLDSYIDDTIWSTVGLLAAVSTTPTTSTTLTTISTTPTATPESNTRISSETSITETSVKLASQTPVSSTSSIGSGSESESSTISTSSSFIASSSSLTITASASSQARTSASATATTSAGSLPSQVAGIGAVAAPRNVALIGAISFLMLAL
ncbi:hypothetical protein BP5796_12024 [Coleophoma crateriformis]|uniref:DUF7707 domain-containing protein n=1 Tax=Coleophoma crateriformis TaxID=565419 RepID=A0A3D8QBS4_9HELO|nr:hypothetical protein BP5796_12024 [Coleophoma crateriformis]